MKAVNNGRNMGGEFPLVSVLMPAYNAEVTVVEAMQSILWQTYPHFEFIIINDGSTDATRERILSVSDARIRYYENEVNQGLVYTLNRGIDLCRGKYIARMDADDISLPTRFEKQVEVMEKSPNIIVCGTEVSLFGDLEIVKKVPDRAYRFISAEEFQKNLVLESGIAHPSVMMRKSILDEYHLRYDADYPCAEDYKFWIDLVSYGDFYIISERLLRYRLSATQISTFHSLQQQESSKKCRWLFLQRNLSPETFSLLKENIDLKVLRRVRKETDNIKIWETLYTSFSTFSWMDWPYFILSGDIFRLKRFCFSSLVLKRFRPYQGTLL